jgi:hypothetical protein
MEPLRLWLETGEKWGWIVTNLRDFGDCRYPAGRESVHRLCPDCFCAPIAVSLHFLHPLHPRAPNVTIHIHIIMAIHRITMFKIPKESDVSTALEAYKKLEVDQKKVGEFDVATMTLAF